MVEKHVKSQPSGSSNLSFIGDGSFYSCLFVFPRMVLISTPLDLFHLHSQARNFIQKDISVLVFLSLD
jgi:hypothetical protein